VDAPVLTQLFDSLGRLIPSDGERVYRTTDRRYFTLDQPELDYAAIHRRVSEFLHVPSLESSLSADSFRERCEELRRATRADEAMRNLFAGVHVPFLLAASEKEQDMGQEMNAVLLDAVGSSFTAKFPEFSFRSYPAGELEGKMSVVPGCRYENLIQARRQGPVVGWYFPNCMAGFAIPDQRSLMKRLPESLMLSGPLEAASAFIGLPEILMKKDNYPNLLALCSVKPPQDHFFYFFEAYGWNLTFNQRSMIGAVSEYYAGGLTIIG